MFISIEAMYDIKTRSWGSKGAQALVIGNTFNIVLADMDDCDSVIEAALEAKRAMLTAQEQDALEQQEAVTSDHDTAPASH